jgi:hypothetical protein
MADGGRDDRSSATGTATELRNAFDEEFLDRLLEDDPPPTALAAATAGPWRVEPTAGGGHAVLRVGERLPDDEPAAVFDERQVALLLAAALPGSAARERFRLQSERDGGGYAVARAGRPVGRMAWFDPHLTAVLSALEELLASPAALALLLEAAGRDALEQAGKALARHLARR